MTNTPLASHTLKWWNIFSFCYFYWILTHSSNKNYLFMDASTTWSKAPSILLSNNIFFIKLTFVVITINIGIPWQSIVTMLAFTVMDPGTIPDQGTKIPQAAAKNRKDMDYTYIVLISCTPIIFEKINLKKAVLL